MGINLATCLQNQLRQAESKLQDINDRIVATESSLQK